MVNQPMESADTVAIATRSELGGGGEAGGGLLGVGGAGGG